MIDPQVSMVFALHSNPSAYTVLVGSGVSVGAGIPTGWQVVLDLISRVARVLGEDPGDDVASWYQERFGEEPDYSKLLDTLAKSPAERSALLRSYFEPTAEERARGVKVPGAAHTALADLAATGHVRLFVTTNFDRLIEQGLEAAGVTPRVLSTPDSILGSPPLSHAGCTVLKLHGDYLDTRIKNTPAELDSYDEVVDELLDRIIAEHGFIVCGWSATWDTALRRAFERSKSRRYTTYWADVVPPGEHASSLIELLHGEFVEVRDADTFFSDIVRNLEALGDINPSPRSLDPRTLVGELGHLRAEGVTLRNAAQGNQTFEQDFRQWENRCLVVIRQLSTSDMHYFDTLDIFRPRVEGPLLVQVLDGKLQRLIEIMQRHDPDFVPPSEAESVQHAIAADACALDSRSRLQ